MPTFAYRAIDASGRRTKGRISAPTSAAVTHELETQGLLPIDVREAAPAESGAGFGFNRRRGVLEFTRAVAALLPAGMPLARALRTSATASPEALRPALEVVRTRVERGDELATALAEHPRLFSPLYIGVVRAGEKSGELDGAFERLARHLEREDELRSKLISMSIYPFLLALVGVGAVSVLVFFVLPRFADLLLTSGAALPRSTATMLSIATFAREYWRWFLPLPLLLALVYALLRHTDAGRRIVANVLIHLPIFGSWRRQALAAAFARITGELLAGGAPLFNALADTRDCIADPVARDETDRIRTRVREGSSLNSAIGEYALFPAVLTQLVALGEESGRLSDFMLKAAELLERRTERSAERLVALAEPVMIVAFGGMVALVALALLQAIYGVNAGSFR